MTELAQHPSPRLAVQDNRHPLDPLSEAELASACIILKTEKCLGPDTRFGFVQLGEPAKADVLAWEPGKPLARRAAATVVGSIYARTRGRWLDADTCAP
jgi:primary-amine oxidase